MVTRVMEFFAMPQEFIDFLNEIVISMRLHAVLANRVKDSKVKTLTVPLNLKKLKEVVLHDIFLTDTEIQDDIPVVDVNRPQEGWIQIVLPKERDGFLFEASIGIKTDWYDKETQAVCENKASVFLFDRIKRRLKKNLSFPLLGYDIRVGDPGTYKIGYTEKAKNFLKNGGEFSSGFDEKNLTYMRYAIDESDIRVDPDYQLPKKCN